MITRLSRYAEGVMEAAWIATVIVVPVFFNILSSRIFEPDKITILRTLALLILAAWSVKLIEENAGNRREVIPIRRWWRFLKETPLMIPVFSLGLVYLLSTFLSVSPRVSFWGSYQRLQGTFTTFSYLVFFASLVANLRHRSQIHRLISAAIISSLPISLYGVLQHYKLDPIPWGGDVSLRIAANMGNSIFVAAYLILVFPPTFMRVVESFEALLTDRGELGINFVRSIGYVFIASFQVIALYFSQSRGPWLGWAASLVFIGLGLSLIWRARWMTISGVMLALVAGVFLILLNIPNGPFAHLRARPEFGRLGQLLDAQSRTGRVRTLIWSGAVQLVSPHPPLEYPDGKRDRLNFLRPIIGYGPESMYVAYNPFYPPELTQVEKRNASPDRSHNETWDSLVITGILGLITYLALFGSVLYFGLKWLGLVPSERQRNLFLVLYLLGGVISSVIFVVWRGWEYLGVALPFGMILGIIFYLILTALFGHYEAPKTLDGKLRSYILLALLAVIIAHYVEINFGIAIAATRTYFWVTSALLLLVGYIFPSQEEAILVERRSVGLIQENLSGGGVARDTSYLKKRQHETRTELQPARKKRRPARTSMTSIGVALPEWVQEALVAGFIVAILMITLGYDFITNSSRSSSISGILVNSMTRLVTQNRASPGILAMVLTSWLVGVILLSSEVFQELREKFVEQKAVLWKILAITIGSSFVLAIIFWILHAGELAALSRTTATTFQEVLRQVQRTERLITSFYVYLVLIIFGMAFFLPMSLPVTSASLNRVGYVIFFILVFVSFLLSSNTNLRVIQADIAFKTADLFARSNTWPVAISIYNRAIDLAPNEDYYYLFLGRAYLEYARTLTNESERQRFFEQAAKDLGKAQEINPLNIDHTANLARLHSLWAAYMSDQAQRAEKAELSDAYFSRAVVLSPNNAKLWDEWASLYLNIIGQPDEAFTRLQRALELDPNYDWTYALLGDYYSRFVFSPQGKPEGNLAALLQAENYYTQALQLASRDSQLRDEYAFALADVQAQLGKLDQAIQSYNLALELTNNVVNRWKIELGLAKALAQKGDFAEAIRHAKNALVEAPESQKAEIEALILEWGGQP